VLVLGLYSSLPLHVLQYETFSRLLLFCSSLISFVIPHAHIYTLFRNHRGLRHYWGLRVRGQHTKTTGRRGKTVGVSKKR
jgi:hypothetical protein